MDKHLTGLVVKATGSWYEVEADNQLYKCRLRGRLRLKGVRSTSPIVVGDFVRFSSESGDDDAYTIDHIEPRRNYIIRRASNLSKESHIIAANIDRAMLVATLFHPETATEFVDRFLITCEAYKVPATIILAKCDLARQTPEAMELFCDTYRQAGYEVVEVCSLTGEGLERVSELLSGATTLIAGNSGVGKSTLIGAIEPGLDIRTGEISQSHNKGKHTTTFSTMYPLSKSGGYIIDTPGIKGFGLIDIEDSELWHYYPEMMHYSADCQFYNCTHTHEPKCAVRNAVESGEIAYSRYESYLKIMDEDDKYRK